MVGPHAAGAGAVDRRGQELPASTRHRQGAGDFAYPIAVQTADGRIHVVYTSDGRRVINHAVFSEDWLMAPKATLTVTLRRLRSLRRDELRVIRERSQITKCSRRHAAAFIADPTIGREAAVVGERA